MILEYFVVKVKVKGCYSRFYFHVLDYCQMTAHAWLSIKPRMHHKQIEIWVLHMRISVTFYFRQLPAIANPNSIHSL